MTALQLFGNKLTPVRVWPFFCYVVGIEFGLAIGYLLGVA